MSLTTILFGRRLASDEEEKEQIGAFSGIPVLGLDALASASYGPEVVESRWYHYLLRNHTASILKWLLLFRGGKGVVIVNTPFYLDDSPKAA